jgi:hypothetical protein
MDTAICLASRESTNWGSMDMFRNNVFHFGNAGGSALTAVARLLRAALVQLCLHPTDSVHSSGRVILPR